MLEDILSLASKQAEQVEVYEVGSTSTPVGFEANRLKSLETKQSHGAAVRLVRNGRVGFASTTDLRDPRRLVEAALSVAEFGAEARFSLPGQAAFPEVPVYDPAVSDVTVEEMAAAGQSLIDRVRGYNSDILCDAGLSRSVMEQRTLNSAGADISYRKSVMGASISGTLTRGTDILTIYEDDAWCRRLVDIDALAERLVVGSPLGVRVHLPVPAHVREPAGPRRVGPPVGALAVEVVLAGGHRGGALAAASPARAGSSAGAGTCAAGPGAPSSRSSRQAPCASR